MEPRFRVFRHPDPLPFCVLFSHQGYHLLYYCLFVFAVSFPFLTLTRDVVDRPEYNALLFFSVSGLFSVFYFTRKFIALNKSPKWDKRLKYYIIGKTALVVVYSTLHFLTSNIFVILATYIPALFAELVLMVLLAVALIKTATASPFCL